MTGGHGSKIERTREAAIAALLTCRTAQEAAASVGIADSTMRRWLKEPEFAAEYDQARRGLLLDVSDDLARSARRAVAVLVELMESNTTSAAVRVAACRAILDNVYKAREAADLEARMAAIEAALSAQTPGGAGNGI